MNQWHVAALHPPHLAAICAWEGAADLYRDATHHGGILSHVLAATGTTSRSPWSSTGSGERGPRSRGHRRAGGRPADADRGGAGRGPGPTSASRSVTHPLDGEFYRRAVRGLGARSPSRCCPPPTGAARACTPRGNFEGFMPGRVGAEVAGGARPGALDALLHRLRGRPAEAVLRLLPARATTTAGGTSRRSSCRSAPSDGFIPRPSRSGRSPAPAGRSCICARTQRCAGDRRRRRRRAECRYGRLGDGRHVLRRRRSSARPRSPGRSPRGCSCPRHGADADLFCVLRVFDARRRRGHLPRRDRPAHPGRARAGCGCRTASSTRT